MRRALLLACLGLLAWPAVAHARTIAVRTQPQFVAAIAQLRATGGTIVLQPRAFVRKLVVPGRFGGQLRIVGRPGSRVQRLLLYRTQNVSVGPLTVFPVAGDARIRVLSSRAVVLHEIRVSAAGTLHSAGAEIFQSSWVSIRHGNFSHCGDRYPNWVNCLRVHGGSNHIFILRSWFHDCRGCDLVHGRIGSYLTVRDSRFERALPCRLEELNMTRVRHFLGAKDSVVRCSHQDDIELFAGSHLVFDHNVFGVYQDGGAQLYITGHGHDDLIENNLFVGTDPLVPGYESRVGVTIGGNGKGPKPTYVRIVHNRILTGAPRGDGYAASISISNSYGWRIAPPARPLIAHNVIGLLETPNALCRGARMVDNTILRGHDCAGRRRH